MNEIDDGRKIYSVSELNREIKVVLENAYPQIWLEGEISNFRVYSSGHMYFSLKYEESQINAVMFQGLNRFLTFKLEDGLKVIVRGRVSAYPKRGDYQVIIDVVEPAGKGALQLAFEQLKTKLEKEGLFSQERKRALPLLPHKIGVVTSPTGAAIRDILSVINRRFANVEILLYPVRVQGDEAKYDIVEAIEYLNKQNPDIDVLLVGRGGGSYEDLWAFNEEIVVRAIAASKIPVISCVGHEIDFTIADFVADMRAPTPSAAAELVVRNKSDLIEKINNARHQLVSHMQFVIERLESRLKHVSESRTLKSPFEVFQDKALEIDDLLVRAIETLQRLVKDKENEFKRQSEKLGLLSPLNVLNRGYAICWKLPENKILKESTNVRAGEQIKVRLPQGEITGRVESVH
jgi:exodeoxyribonuclease VII large subunit